MISVEKVRTITIGLHPDPLRLTFSNKTFDLDESKRYLSISLKLDENGEYQPTIKQFNRLPRKQKIKRKAKAK